MDEAKTVSRWGTTLVVTNDFWDDEPARTAFLEYQEVMLERGARDAGHDRLPDRPMNTQSEDGVTDPIDGPRRAFPGEDPDCKLLMLSIDTVRS